jgi:hypothetical protein
MIPIYSDINKLTKEGYFGEAGILDFYDGGYRVRIISEDPYLNGTQYWAKPAIAFPCNLKWGDSVLVAGAGMESLFIIGLINGRAGENSMSLKDGTTVKVEGHDSETLKVFSKQGEMIFAYDSETKKSSVHIQKGDLEFITQNGRIDFVASKGIRFFSEHPIEITSLENIRLVAKKMETLVETIMEKATNVYRAVEKLTQLKTGRMRTLVEGTSHLITRKAFYKAEEDFKIKGEKIHLG